MYTGALTKKAKTTKKPREYRETDDSPKDNKVKDSINSSCSKGVLTEEHKTAVTHVTHVNVIYGVPQYSIANHAQRTRVCITEIATATTIRRF